MWVTDCLLVVYCIEASVSYWLFSLFLLSILKGGFRPIQVTFNSVSKVSADLHGMMRPTPTYMIPSLQTFNPHLHNSVCSVERSSVIISFLFRPSYFCSIYISSLIGLLDLLNSMQNKRYCKFISWPCDKELLPVWFQCWWANCFSYCLKWGNTFVFSVLKVFFIIIFFFLLICVSCPPSNFTETASSCFPDFLRPIYNKAIEPDLLRRRWFLSWVFLSVFLQHVFFFFFLFAFCGTHCGVG